MFVGPILKRDLISFLRSRWAFLLLFLALLLTGSIVSQKWVQLREIWRLAMLVESNTTDLPRMVSNQGRQLFHSMMWWQLFILSFLSPMTAATSIAGERERDTLTLLLSSPVRLGQIIWEKYFSSIAFLLLIILASIPLLSLSLLARGLAIDEIITAEVLSIVTALGYGMVGLLCSTIRPRVYETYLLSILVVLGIGLFIPFGPTVWHYLLTLNWREPAIYQFGLHELSPFVALDRILTDADIPNAGAFAGNPLLGLFRYSMVWAFAIVFLYWFAYLRLKQLALGERSILSVSRDSDPRESPDGRAGAGGTVIYQDWDIRHPMIGLERHRQWFGRLAVLLRLLYLALLISVITLPLASYRGSWLFFTLPFLAATFFTVPLSATTLGGERDGSTLDILRTTLIGDRTIIHAKYTISFQLSLILALTLYLPGLLTVLIYGFLFGRELDLLLDNRDVIPLLCQPILLVITLMFYNALGIRFSSLFRSTNLALVATTLCVLTLLLLPLPVLHLLSGLAAHSAGHAVGKSAVTVLSGIVLATNPLAILISLSSEGSIELLGLRIHEAIAPFHSKGLLFLMLYGIVCAWSTRLLLQTAERDLFKSTG